MPDSSTSRTRITPLENIAKTIDLPEGKKAFLPRKWELLGDVLLMKIPEELKELKGVVARAYAAELSAKTVLEDRGIAGEMRTPQVELLYGRDTETVHKENGVLFKLDCARLMFSSGNIDERIRMATISNAGEVVVDMFAGIGFFSVPIAVHSQPKVVHAIELNPVAFRYLKANIALNHVEDIVIPFLGDNRNFEKKGIADRIVMGYLSDTHLFLDSALDILGDRGGIIHYHEKCPNELLETRPLDMVRREVEKKGRTLELLGMRQVKSYAPGVSHVVLDIRVDGV